MCTTRTRDTSNERVALSRPPPTGLPCSSSSTHRSQHARYFLLGAMQVAVTCAAKRLRIADKRC
eukprot:199705-Pleurochrysis_carterae.AAC.3